MRPATLRTTTGRFRAKARRRAILRVEPQQDCECQAERARGVEKKAQLRNDAIHDHAALLCLSSQAGVSAIASRVSGQN